MSGQIRVQEIDEPVEADHAVGARCLEDSVHVDPQGVFIACHLCEHRVALGGGPEVRERGVVGAPVEPKGFVMISARSMDAGEPPVHLGMPGVDREQPA